jgi:hypothetical protein
MKSTSAVEVIIHAVSAPFWTAAFTFFFPLIMERLV